VSERRSWVASREEGWVGESKGGREGARKEGRGEATRHHLGRRQGSREQAIMDGEEVGGSNAPWREEAMKEG
jgi:hypothetical protein